MIYDFMKRTDKLKQNWEFRRLYNRGKCVATSEFILYFAKGKSGRVRLGITAGKKIGSAVRRNRAKRIINAAFDSCLPRIKKGYDFCIVARAKILSLKSTQVTDMIFKKLTENGLIDE
ncbi:MAG: ribonuclease P protein component [Clostridia bacterium]|nr:ribonuclease P protein component [Clostridia bacterium]